MTSCPPQRVQWHNGPMLGFDLETTGIDVEQVRIVTSALVHIQPGQPVNTTNRLINPGIDIPEQATAIHGITTAHAFEHGEPPANVLHDTVTRLAQALQAGTPIAGMNLVYDLTLLDRECRRHFVPRLSETVEHVAPIIDVLVLDKAMDRYRKGSRKLTALADHYGITLDNAHNSAADALAACRIAYRLAEKYPTLQIDLNQLHTAQIRWAGGQRASLAAYKAAQGDPLHDTDTTWPIRPAKIDAHA